MKNIVIVDVDTNRVDEGSGKPTPVIIGKYTEPSSSDEVVSMINLDIVTLTEGLITLIMTSHLNGYGHKDDYMLQVTESLTEGLKIDTPESAEG
jgi:hypothetical protein